MLFFLFGRDELQPLFERLGYDYDADTARRNVEYYDARTSHGSTLSYVAHAGVLAALDPESSWERFLVALESDIGDIQGGTTKEGIHMGVMAGTLDLMQRGYLGTHIRGDTLHFDPRIPGEIERLALSMQFRRSPIRVVLDASRLTISVHPEGLSGRIKVGVRDQVRELSPGEQCSFEPAPSLG
jgi:trehalose/maltose hydrolase-like predicted phosphorylase